MGDVIIAGIGQTDVGEHWNVGLRDLALAAIEEAVRDAHGLRPEAIYVGNMLAPNLSNQAHLGALLADYAGLVGIEATTVEAAGASGGAALRQGYLAVASGMINVALVVGVEKFTDRIGAEVEAAVATTGDSDFEAVQGLTPASQAAMLMKRYMHEHGVPTDGFAGFALTAHLNGAGNPHAMFRRPIEPHTYSHAPMITEPLNQYDIAPSADGAAAIVVTREGLLNSPMLPPVYIAGSASVVDTLAIHDRQDALEFGGCGLSSSRALAQAGTTLGDMDFFEYHDSYSIYAALALESVGFAERGRGDCPGRQDPGRHHGWSESSRLRWRSHGRLPGCRGDPAASGSRGQEPAEAGQARARPVHGRSGLDGC
jgi:acetyl-CoA C-acetyltransferase